MVHIKKTVILASAFGFLTIFSNAKAESSSQIEQTILNNSLFINIQPVENMKIIDKKDFKIPTSDGKTIIGSYSVYLPYMKMTSIPGSYSAIMDLSVTYSYFDKNGKKIIPIKTYKTGNQSVQLPELEKTQEVEKRFIEPHKIPNIYISLTPKENEELDVKISESKDEVKKSY